MLETMEEPEKSPIGIMASPPAKVAGTVAQVKCISSNACSMGKEQEELKPIVQLENYNRVAITVWLDESHSCSGWL